MLSHNGTDTDSNKVTSDGRTNDGDVRSDRGTK